MLASWGAGFIAFFLTANIYESYYYPDDPDPVYFDIAIAGLAAWLLVGTAGTCLFVTLFFCNRKRYIGQESDQ